MQTFCNGTPVESIQILFIEGPKSLTHKDEIMPFTPRLNPTTKLTAYGSQCRWRVRKRWGFRRLPRAKPTSQVDDLYHILITLWVWYDSVFADEIQRLYVSTGILLASVSACRLVSLFDTRVYIGIDEAEADNDANSWLENDIFTEKNNTMTDSVNLDEGVVFNSDDNLNAMIVNEID